MANRKPALFSPEGVICRTPEETAALGAEMVKGLEIGAVISLEGPLGAGKTQFSKGFVRAFGCDTEASSPSFALLHEYTGGVLPLFHYDFYRLDEAKELQNAGYDDCLADGVTLIEWGNKFPEVLPPDAWRLQFEILPGDARRIRRL